MIGDTLSPIRNDPGPVHVTLIVPCLNEAKYIEDCLTSLLQADYPVDLMEIIVLDGQSTDGTRDILDNLVQCWPQIRVIDNPGASKPRALNLGIDEARHDIVMRIDAHATYPPDYVRQLVRALHVYNADNVGGIRFNTTQSTGVVASALAAVLTHPFGVGDAKHYTGVKSPVLTDIVFLFCVHKKLFDEIGNFDERLTRGQDREFNLRLSTLGRKMVLCPSVTCTYYARERFISFVRWAYNSGVTPFEISRIVGKNLVSVRNLVPPAFSASVIGLFFLGFARPMFWVLACGLLTLYLSVGLLVGFAQKGSQLGVRLLMPISFFSWHFSYGVGALHGLMNLLLKHISK